MLLARALLATTLVLGALTILSCGGGNPAPPPVSPPPSPSPGSPPLPNVHGDWSGTLASGSFSTRVVAARFIQQADCVDGSWNTTDSGGRWIGAISAFARPGTLEGDMSFEIPMGSKLCTGVGALTGEASDAAATLTWTLKNYSADNCAGGVPSTMTLKLERPR